MFSPQETTLVICGTKRGPVGTSQRGLVTVLQDEREGEEGRFTFVTI